jgi:hypothetical protein
VTYATDRLLDEVAYVAYNFHWPLGDILDLEHADRQRFVGQIGQFRSTSERPAAAVEPQPFWEA